MDPPWFRKITIMFEQLNTMGNNMNRYQQTNVVEHLASQYVLGTLTERVNNRIATLRATHDLLDQRIHFWEAKLVHLDQQTPELPARDSTWNNILSAIEEPETASAQATKTSHSAKGLMHSIIEWFSASSKNRFASAFSVAALLMFALYFINPNTQNTEQLSYVAVLTQTDGDAHIVASTYGESKKLIINVINSPELTQEQTHELWVVSKTDNEARSLGVIPKGEALIEQQLTQAQWRLIKDSKSLIITVEELGGSPIGEPGDVIVSRGLCVRLQEWTNNA